MGLPATSQAGPWAPVLPTTGWPGSWMEGSISSLLEVLLRRGHATKSWNKTELFSAARGSPSFALASVLAQLPSNSHLVAPSRVLAWAPFLHSTECPSSFASAESKQPHNPSQTLAFLTVPNGNEAGGPPASEWTFSVTAGWCWMPYKFSAAGIRKSIKWRLIVSNTETLNI